MSSSTKKSSSKSTKYVPFIIPPRMDVICVANSTVTPKVVPLYEKKPNFQTITIRTDLETTVEAPLSSSSAKAPKLDDMFSNRPAMFVEP